MADSFEELDQFVVGAKFNPDIVELTFVEDEKSSESVSIVSTLQMEIADEDVDLQRYMIQIQEIFQEMITRGHQKARDDK